MKFFCEYCGNRIDAEKDAKCPNCGASYKKNKEFIKLQKIFLEEKYKEDLYDTYRNIETIYTKIVEKNIIKKVKKQIKL